MIKGKFADILLASYILGTLYFRFTLEDSLQNHPILSICLGAIMLLLAWAVIKVGWLQPDYFGLLGSTKMEDKKKPTDDDNPLFI